MERRNAYEHLRIADRIAGERPEIKDSENVYSYGEESVTLHLAETREGKWAYGYKIYFIGGRVVDRPPGYSVGWFRSARDAQLFFLGHLMQYREHFSEGCIHEVKRRILGLLEEDIFGGLGGE